MLKKYFLLLAFSVAAVSLLLIIPIGIENSYIKVNTIKASATDVFTSVDCSGTIQAADTERVTLGCQVKISKDYFQIGDHVNKGDKLLDIDKNVAYQSLANSNSSSLNRNNSTSSQVSSAEAESALKQALSMGVIDQNTYGSIINQFNSSSDSSKSLPSASTSETEDTKIMDSVEQSLYAPISGVLTNIEDGTSGFTPAGVTIAEISDLSSFRVKAQVEEKNIKDVKVGQQVLITGTGFNGTYSGVVKQIYPIVQNVSTTTGTDNMVYVIVNINNPSANLKPGLTADLKIKTSEQKGVITLPYDYIKQDDSETEYVYVFKNGHAVRKNVTTGIEDNDSVEIEKGIARGDIVIEDFSDILSDGTKVKIK
jgi:RND family efflux transporter MFP subunit